MTGKLTGTAKYNIEIGNLTSISPPRYACRCKCGTQFICDVETLNNLETPACPSPSCEAVLAERQKAEQEAERVALETKSREAQETFQKTFLEFAKVKRANLLSKPDIEFPIDSENPYSLPEADADLYNASEAEKYQKKHPEFYASKANLATLGKYFGLNGCQIVSAQTLGNAINRLSEFGLLENTPEPEPEEAEPVRTPVPAQSRAERRRELFEPTGEKEIDKEGILGEYGFDVNGKRTFLSNVQLAALGSAELQAFYRLPRGRSIERVTRF